MLRRWRQAKEGQGRVVLLSGGPALASPLRRVAAAAPGGQPCVRVQYFCSPHHQNSAQHGRRAPEAGGGFEHDDSAEDQLQLRRVVHADSAQSLDETIALLADLLSIRGPDRPTEHLTPQQRKGGHLPRSSVRWRRWPPSAQC